MGREGGQRCYNGMEGGVPPTPSVFSPFLLNLGWKQSPWSLGNKSLYYPSDPIFSSPAWAVPPQLPSCSAPPGGQGRGQSECMRLREDKAGKAQARGRYRGGIGGRWNPSPSGRTDLHGKSRMTSQLRRRAWGGKGEREEQRPLGVWSTGLEAGVQDALKLG